MTMQSPIHQSFDHTPVNPDEWEMVFRSVIVRLGPDWNWYENTGHGSSGIIDVRIDADRNLVVETDFDTATEKILYAGANPDHTLVAKGVMAGGSGGSSLTKYRIVSSKQLATAYPAYATIPPNSRVFDSLLDNLWIQQVSLRPRS